MAKIFKRRIQATEGQNANIDKYCLSDFSGTNKIPGGAENNYKTYSSQVSGVCNKYNGRADWGCQLTRALIDIRAGFLVSEGINVSSENDPALEQWIMGFLKRNLLTGSRLVSLAKGCEMRGRELYRLKPVSGGMPLVVKISQEYECSGTPGDFYLQSLAIKSGDEKIPVNPKYFIMFVTGGDGTDVNNTTTKTGILLNDIDNYDRAKKDLRINNHILARITPVFETTTDAETNSILKFINQTAWKIGKVFAGQAKFKYETPGTGAADNLRQEIDTSIMSISGTSGVPVHWLGHTDLMSNRATAADLYQSLLNATAAERLAIEESLYNMIVKAQELYIENGGESIKSVSFDFTVKLPAVDYSSFESMVKGLSLAYVDGAISMTDYRDKLPGIDPVKTRREVGE